MHETLSPSYKGHVDVVSDVGGGLFKLVGWVAGGSYSSGDVGLVDSSGRSVECSVITGERPDVHSFYAGREGFLRCGLIVRFRGAGPLFLTVRGERVLEVVSTSNGLDEILRRRSSIPSVVVVDDFYENPDEVRRYALSQEFKEDERYHKGLRTSGFIPSWAADRFAGLLGVSGVDFVGASGVFQYCASKDKVVYHYDSQQYAAMVYLTPDAPLRSGTETFRSNITGLYGKASPEDAVRLGKDISELDSSSFGGNNFYDRHNMELVDSLANVYNRCVIFNAQLIHAAGGYFGSGKEDSRLFHLYFFNLR